MPPFIPHRNIQPAHQTRRAFDAIIPKGMTVDDILKAEAWQQYAPELHVGTLIEVRAEDGSFDGLLRVTERGVHGTGVRIIYMTEYGAEDKAPAADASAYAGATVSWGGPAQRFRIVLADGTVALKDFPDRDAAEAKRLELASA